VLLRHEGYHDAVANVAEATEWCVFGNFNTYVILRATCVCFMTAVAEALSASYAT
jgi:hypothetical protein